MKFIVEIRDTSFNIRHRVEKEATDLMWSYSRIGGCGEFSFTIPRKLFQERAISGEYNVRIYSREDSADSYSLRYQGLIENKIPSVRGGSETVPVSGHGYYIQLKRVYLNNVTYTGQEVSAIVTDILDNYVVNDTDITYSASDIENTGVTLSSIQFNEYADSALEKLAEIVGNREFGVDKNRAFFFKEKSDTVGFRFPLGYKVLNYSQNQDFKQIVNRVFIQGAQVGGTYHFFGPYDDMGSQAKYNLRVSVKQNSSITSSSVASQFATSTLSEFKDASIRANFDLVDYAIELESTNPTPLINILTKQDKYGQKKFGQGIYCGLIDFSINRINYYLSNNNTLKVNADIGRPRPSISESLGQIEYTLEQQRSASL